MASILKGIVPASPDDLQIKVGADWSVVTVNDFEISFRNVEGRYPNWKAVIPHNNPLELVVDTKQLIGAIKRTTVFQINQHALYYLKLIMTDLLYRQMILIILLQQKKRYPQNSKTMNLR